MYSRALNIASLIALRIALSDKSGRGGDHLETWTYDEGLTCSPF